MCHIYFIQAERCRLIKIGYSEDPRLRLRGLQTQNADRLTLLAVRPGTITDERDLHKRFASLRQHGEWFKVTRRLTRYIEETLATCDQTIRPCTRQEQEARKSATPGVIPSRDVRRFDEHSVWRGVRPDPEAVMALFGVRR